MPHPVDMLVLGALFSVSQWLVLRGYLALASAWVVATSAAVALPHVVREGPLSTAGLALLLPWISLTGLQATVLRCGVWRAGAWLVWSFVGVVVGLLGAFLVAVLLVLTPLGASDALIGALFGAFYGAVTGYPLSRWLKPRRPLH